MLDDIQMAIAYVGRKKEKRPMYFADRNLERDIWDITLTNKATGASVDYKLATGTAVGGVCLKQVVYAIHSDITGIEYYNFEGWCKNCGIDGNKHKARKAYDYCNNLQSEIERVFPDWYDMIEQEFPEIC